LTQQGCIALFVSPIAKKSFIFKAVENNQTGRNEEKLSEDDLKEKVHFDKFMVNYKPIPFYKSFKFYGTLIAAGLLLLGAFYLSNDESDPNKLEKSMHEEAFVKPPWPFLKLLPSSFYIQGNTDTVLCSSSGTLIHVPPNAFLDKKGKIVKGSIELHFREFHDRSDFFASGIPLSYDSAGRRYFLESAGITEISAQQNDELLFANSDQRIEIDMVSDIPGYQFNVYYLDTIEKRWEFMKKEFVLNNLSSAFYLNESSAAVLQLSPPQKASDKLASFDISFDKKQFPELTVYDGVSFEVNEDEKYYDRKLAMKEWDKVKLERLTDGKHYLVTFTNPNEEHVFKVHPVYSGSDFTRARELYLQKLRSHELERGEKRMATALLKGKMDSMSRSRMYFKGKGRFLPTNRSLVRRQYSVGRFGIWNTACLVSVPKGRKVYAKYTDMQNNELALSAVFLAEKERQVIFSFVPGNYNLLSYNPKVKNTLWGLTKENKLVVCDSGSFNKAAVGPDSVKFSMKTIEPTPSSVPELKGVLGLD
jgi:hypothetical protein